MANWLTQLFAKKKENQKKSGPQSQISTGSLTSAHAAGHGMVGISRNSSHASMNANSTNIIVDDSSDVDDFAMGVAFGSALEAIAESSTSIITDDSWSGDGGDFSGAGASGDY